jgi:D-serine deaminase-like pyridoxal phosphate-dependent protein
MMTPYVVADLDVIENNIKKMITSLKKYHIKQRPHIKTHKSVYFANKQLKLGACGITCAKVTEVQVFVENGFKDILLAYPIVGDEKLNLLGELMNKANITTIVNDKKHVDDLSKLSSKIKKIIPVLIEIDGGINRGGLKPGKETIDFYNSIKNTKGIKIKGFEYYGGAIYEEETLEAIKNKAKEDSSILLDAKNLVKDKNITILSSGSSYSSRFPQQLEGITESRAGNYIFNDVNALKRGLCNVDDCALRIITTVVSTPNKGSAIIDAGSKTLTSDLCSLKKGYGYVVEYPEMEIYKLNEEHGFLKFRPDINLKIGQKISIIPNHACVIPNLCDEILGINKKGEKIKIKIDARGKNK